MNHNALSRPGFLGELCMKGLSLKNMPKRLFYLPLLAYCFYLGCRYRSLSLPSIANPLIPTGGLCDESKSDILKSASPQSSPWVARYFTQYAATLSKSGSENLCSQYGLDYPLIVKPDIGCHGEGIKFVEDNTALRRVCACFNPNILLMIQQYIPWPFEAGISYCRLPGQHHGRITALGLKKLPHIIGDGVHSVRDFIKTDRDLKKRDTHFMALQQDYLDSIPPRGSYLLLSRVGNHCKGAVFEERSDLITPELSARIDEIIRGFPEFYIGRIDLKFRSLEELKHGRALRIIEVNGIAGEPVGIWDKHMPVYGAYRHLMRQWRLAYKVGYANRKRGHKPCGIWACLKAWFHQTYLIKTYPQSD